MLCIVGPSGCGQDHPPTVFAGLEQPTGGSAPIRSDDPARPTKAMVFQGAGIFPWMTVEQNVAYGLQLRGVPKAERTETARRWIGRLAGAIYEVVPGSAFGRYAARVGLARAFAYGPEVLLMDEPFGALDAHTRLISTTDLA